MSKRKRSYENSSGIKGGKVGKKCNLCLIALKYHHIYIYILIDCYSKLLATSIERK